jgi:hypothetical protein
MNRDQVKVIIEKVLKDLGTKYADPRAIDLVFNTGLVESRYEYLMQTGTGPARSFWQVEPATAVSQCENFIAKRYSLVQSCVDVSYVDEEHWMYPDINHWDKILTSSIAAGIIHCRLKFWRVPKPLPDTLVQQAKQWKRYYNAGGKGTENKYIQMVEHYAGE